ncbi:MAG: hypothetical protein GY718_01925 [Lentisphaerae bacterium]|nr:hypothetical protein [Lentisphaerota bacterium]
MKAEDLENFAELLNMLASEKWYGEIRLKMEAGKITIGEKTDKIKFDNVNFMKYKDR